MKRSLKYRWKRLKTVTILAALLPGLAFAEFTREEIEQELMRRRAAARTDEQIQQKVREQDQFQLFNNCQPVRVSWMPIFGDLVQDEAIRAFIEKRLRGAGIHDSEARNFLAVIDFSYFGDFLRFELEYNKFLHDPVSGHTAAAVTWRAGGSAVKDDFSGILKEVGEMTDRFIVAYLSVNERACD